jgi:hypothetical protein
MNRVACYAVLFILFPLLSGKVQAGWWHHHHRDCGSPASYRAAAPEAAPAAAPAAPAYYYYYAVPAQAPAPSQGLLTSFQDIAAILKAIQELRGTIGHTDVTTTTRGSVDCPDITASLSRIEAAQADLRGRMINNAGILQSIGERLGDQGPIMLKLDSLGGAPPPPPAPLATDTAAADVSSGKVVPADAGTAPTSTRPPVELVTKAEFNEFKGDMTRRLEALQAAVNSLDRSKSAPVDPKAKSQSLQPKQGSK